MVGEGGGGVLEDELKEKAVVVAEKAAAADIFAEEVGKEKANVDVDLASACDVSIRLHITKHFSTRKLQHIMLVKCL